jgi:hypothetical protein
MIIHLYDPVNNYYVGSSKEIPDDGPIPLFWTNDPLPKIGEGMFARFNCPGWVVTDMPPPVFIPPVDEEPAIDSQPNEPPVVA